MTSINGGSWSVGTKDGDTVYLDRYSGDLVDGKPSGHLIISANLDPDEALNVGRALIENAYELNPDPGVGPRFPAQGVSAGRWVKLGQVSVDGATLGIADPSSISQRIGWDWGNPPTPEQPVSQPWGSGVQFSSGFGDGSYEVWAWVVEYETPGSPNDERIAQVTMTLIDDDDLKEWDEMP